ncbi:MAG: dihydroxyacetone kinase subunit DhaL [Thaumarchaeota archaeon]|nr:dihydroxyacetone kinase subunit DhaL [Nitrososphaerota archaeon]
MSGPEKSSGPSNDFVTIAQILRTMSNTLRVLDENKRYLNFLDSEIGDAEHGTSMVRGFRAVNERLPAGEYDDIGTILQKAGLILMETVGGAAGPLFGSLYLKGGEVVSGKKLLDKNDLAALFQAGLEGVKTMSGGTAVGDKTMVDALAPAVKALKQSAARPEDTLADALESAVGAAKGGMIETIRLTAKKGRASYLGARSVGHQDPGATTTYLILRTMLDTMRGNGCLKIEKYDLTGMILTEVILPQ